MAIQLVCDFCHTVIPESDVHWTIAISERLSAKAAVYDVERDRYRWLEEWEHVCLPCVQRVYALRGDALRGEPKYVNA